MRVLLYKQDHFGDPDPLAGIWGESGCMSQVRSHRFDAIIGIGGNTAECAIAGKLTWAALEPHQIGTGLDGYPIWNFGHFAYLGSNGSLLETDYPLIARRTEGHFRWAIPTLGENWFDYDLKRIIVIVELAPRSLGSTPKSGVCRPRGSMS